MVKSFAFAVAVVAVGVVAHAQTPRAPVAPVAFDPVKLQTAMIAAQTTAVRPGDEALGCEPLQKELLTSMNDPSIQAYAAKSNADVAKKLAATPTDKTKTPLTAQNAAALAAALNPSMLMASGFGQGVLPTGQPITPEQAQQMMAVQMAQLTTIMPVLMRTQRLTQLAMVKNCAWATGAGLYPGAVLPGAVKPR